MHLSRIITLGSSTLAASFMLSAHAQVADPTVTKIVSAQEQLAATKHWTRQRIASVPAFPMPVDRSFSAQDLEADNQPEAMGPMGAEPAGKQDPNAIQIARSAYWQDWAALEAEIGIDGMDYMPMGTSGIYTSYDVNTHNALWKIYPHIWDGKLTFSMPTGSASCSATAISNNHIVTAAHCVYDTGANQFYSNWAFTPAYRNGNAPYGTFMATSCTVLGAWANLSGGFSINSWTRHDVAVCSMGNNSAGQTLNAAVGWAGRTWNAGNNQLVFNSGYPARTYTDATIASGPAQYLRACTAESFLQTTETLGSGCNWGRGISGGSWMVGYKPLVVTGGVNSVNSGLFINQQNIYGARFNSNNIVVLCNAVGC
ncbi:trypsin-like serine peptidase [Piscinibacter sp.]|uniref:trypsin-like serine peptidase n=1 Tax=Piscinibacter sp. TaxID=1903157 RepID=UPI002BA36562|nr:hypothetical protein [Albitalea sp.]HUG24375.1 hypothetical protein [Albitalea sp.]